MPQKFNPNRMELLKLKKRLRLARRGHKLMKDKFDELMKEFIDLARSTYRLRKVVEDGLLEAYERWSYAFRSHNPDLILSITASLPVNSRVRRKQTRLIGTDVVDYELSIDEEPYFLSIADWSPYFLEGIKESKGLLEKVVMLAGKEESLKNIAMELERTRRRVNALEHILIPQIESQIKQVQMKIDELDRETRTRVVKVKEMLETRKAG